MSGKNYRRHHVTNADKRKFGIVLIIVGAAVILVGFFMSRWENARYATGGGESTVNVDSVVQRQKSIQVNGKTYYTKMHVENYLLMGIDTDGPVKKRDPKEGGGQSDVMMVLNIDNDARTWRLLEINRNTLADIETTDSEGNDTGTKFMQITLAYAMGDGMEASAENAELAVSNLLGGNKIDGYYSVNMDGVSILNDAVGGVPVTITTDFTSVDPSLKLGETITLSGEQALEFVRSRMTVDDGTNEARMRRQEAWLDAFIPKFKNLSSEEILNLYDKLSDYVVTDMGSKTVQQLAEKTDGYTQLDKLELKGTSQIENNYATFRVDPDSLTDTILTMYYTDTPEETGENKQ